MKKLLVKVGWILLILFCLGVLISAYTIVTDLEDESLGQIYSDFYTFNPKNIFTDYKLGGRDLFSMIPMDDLSDDVLESLPEYPPTKRKQQDYLETLNIFYEINFQKPFTTNVRGAFFSIPNCDQVSFGPQSAVIFTAESSFPTSTTYYSYDVDLKDGTIQWHGNSYNPIISWPILWLNLSKIKITAEQALQIAEKQGGEKVRGLNHNQCSIDIKIYSDWHSKNWVVTYNSTIDQFTSLFSMEIDANTGKHKILAEGGAGYYTFNSDQVLDSISAGEVHVFKDQSGQPENNTNLHPVQWTQENYYQIAQTFNKMALNEELDEWDFQDLSFKFDCDDIDYGLQQMGFSFIRSNLFRGNFFQQHIDINPRTNTIKWNYEHDYSVNRINLWNRTRQAIDPVWIKIPADKAVKIVYEAEGKNLYRALRNSGKKCQISGWIDNLYGTSNAKTLEWDVLEWKRDYEILGEQDSQLSAFVNVKTGALKYFKFY